MLSKDVEITLNESFAYASAHKHEFMTVDHLLLALLDNDIAVEILNAISCDIVKLREQLVSYLADTTPMLSDDDSRETQPSVGFQRVVQRAVMHVQSSGKGQVTGANLLVALFGESESQAVYFLNLQDITRLEVINYISHGITEADMDMFVEDDEDGEGGMAERASALEKYAENLNKKAEEGKIDPLIGRGHEIERTVQILCRRRKNNPLLVGEAGVGKTAIAEGLAKRIVDKEVPEVLTNTVVFSLDLGSLVAGTKYRGDFEKRLKAVLSEVKKHPDAIVFIDEIHTIIGAGATTGGSMDASNLLKPALSSGELRCIGSTTYQEYRSIFEKDRALSRRFQKIDVVEPTPDEAIEILSGIAPRFEEHHDVQYTQDALKSAVELSVKHINERFLPDKAIDVIDEAGANRRIKTHDTNVIDVHDIETVVAKMARIPEKQVSTSDKDTLRNLEANLKRVVFGQDKPIDELTTAIKLSRSGLRDPEKPIGSFLFAGPTGVGKTEVSRQLAMALGIELVRFDMSEYMERHTVSRLIGSPPGYVGYEEGGLLTEAINKNPHCVLLLDEIEKAHPDLFNLLLQVMDHGTLTDNNGREASFKQVILIMTTNAGAQVMSRSSMGFTEQDHTTDGMESIKKLFTPEFRNRLDSIVQFNPLEQSSITHVVDKFIIQLEQQLEDKQVALSISQPAREWLANKGYDKLMGARPMGRLIQEKIKKPLSDELLFGVLSEEGGKVNIDLKDDALVFDFSKSGKQKKAKKEPV